MPSITNNEYSRLKVIEKVAEGRVKEIETLQNQIDKLELKIRTLENYIRGFTPNPKEINRHAC